jgi:hypothetical protein
VSKHKAAPAAPPVFELESSEVVYQRALARARREFPEVRGRIEEMRRRRTWEFWWAGEIGIDVEVAARATAEIDNMVTSYSPPSAAEAHALAAIHGVRPW